MKEYNQKTIGEIIESERLMVLEWEKLYWDFFKNAFDLNELMNNCINSFNYPPKYIFWLFFSQIKKNILLAFFSTLRQHHVQMGMNLRQVLEHLSWAIYAMWNSEEEKFFKKDKNWLIEFPENLWNVKNKWLTNNFPKWSEKIKDLKNQINETVAHANIVYAFLNTDYKNIKDGIINMTFFDIFDEYTIKGNLWFVANNIVWILDLMYWANEKYKVFQFSDDFLINFERLSKQNEKLKLELMFNDRFVKEK